MRGVMYDPHTHTLLLGSLIGLIASCRALLRRLIFLFKPHPDARLVLAENRRAEYSAVIR